MTAPWPVEVNSATNHGCDLHGCVVLHVMAFMPPYPRARGHVRPALLLLLISMTAPIAAQRPASTDASEPLRILDVPFLSQPQALCGGAAAAMVLRYWGERGLAAESFAHLVDHSAAGIRTDALIGDLRRRGWMARGLRGTHDLIDRELARSRPVMALIEDRPGTYHYIVIVAAVERAVVFHDPARAPFRVMAVSEFDRRWQKAGAWMAVVLPPEEVPEPHAGPGERTLPQAVSDNRCEWLIGEGVRLAQAGDHGGAERALLAALPCGGSAPWRELAGVRFLQRRWSDATDLAAAAVTEDAGDAHAWRLLATSRFLQDDREGALTAWNVVGEPRVDLVRVDGLTRSRQRVVERSMGAQAGEVLTPARVVHARRRLAELPAALSSRLTYAPVPGGLAEVRASMVERPLVPSSVWALAAVGLSAAATREVHVTMGALSGGGEALGVAWRFWSARPRLAAHAAAPSPWGGVWRVDAFAERQPFDTPAIPRADRRALRVSGSDWVTSRLRWTIGAGMDRWEHAGTFAALGGALRFASHDDRLTGHVEIDRWIGPAPFARAHGVVSVRSSAERLGRAWQVTSGLGVLSNRAPTDLWFAGDTGHARPVLLRAHPLLDAGHLRSDRLGRFVTHGSAEARYWWAGPLATRAGAALFVDGAHVDGRAVSAGTRRDVDAGVGARLALPVLPGIFRVDLAWGLADGATAVSVVYEAGGW
jgi:hypothetical protein